MDVNNQPLLDYIETDDSEEDNQNSIQKYDEGDDIIPINDKPVFKLQEPKDKYRMVYCLFCLLGISSILPYCFFVTANNYWMTKFRNTHDKFMLGANHKLTPLQASFTSYLGLASNIPTLLFYFLNIVFHQRIPFQLRIVGSLIIVFILFVVTTIFVNIDTDSWQQSFLIFTLTVVSVMNAASAVFTSSIFGVVSKFSSNYITALVSGQALSGTFAAVAQIVSLAVGASPAHSAFIYFMVGNITILVTIISYVVLSKSVYFKYHIYDKARLGQNEFEEELIRPRLVSYKTIFRKSWGYLLSAFLVFFVTCSVYPGVTVLVESENTGIWSKVYFVPVITYLLMSLCDYSGRLLAGVLQWPQKSLILNVFNILRIVFIPIFIFCNAQPRGNLPVIFDQDMFYILFLVLFGLTNGYITNISAIYLPRTVDHHERDSVTQMFSIFIGLGITFGSFLCVLFVRYV